IAIKEKYSLVIDSESMLIKTSEIKPVIDSFIKNPYIIYSKISEREKTSPFLIDVINNTSNVLDISSDEYFLEHFMWVYDKEILETMFREHSDIITMVDKVKNTGGRNLFEIQTYLAYIRKNNDRYNYKLINAIEAIKKIDASYLSRFSDVYRGNFGVLEMAGALVSKDNYQKIAEMFDSFNIKMIRSEYYGRMKYHNKFIKAVDPVFLCSSQDHSFGINNTKLSRLLDATDTRWEYN
ncbi:hypothetical protein, partial [Kluyvera ascorbata]|uniref:hypothetical protein n=1 Tax=Kluyvera ascorbata TaxID=51288 RepID=UPI00356832CB